MEKVSGARKRMTKDTVKMLLFSRYKYKVKNSHSTGDIMCKSSWMRTNTIFSIKSFDRELFFFLINHFSSQKWYFSILLRIPFELLVLRRVEGVVEYIHIMWCPISSMVMIKWIKFLYFIRALLSAVTTYLQQYFMCF